VKRRMRHVCNVVLLASVVEVVDIESGAFVVVMLDDDGDVTSVSFWGKTVASTVGPSDDVVLLEIIVVDVSTVLVRVDVATGDVDALVLCLLIVVVVLLVVGVVAVLMVVVVVLGVPRLGPRFGSFEVATVVLRVVVVLMLDLLVVLITGMVVASVVVVVDDVCTSTTVVVVVVDVLVEF